MAILDARLALKAFDMGDPNMVRLEAMLPPSLPGEANWFAVGNSNVDDNVFQAKGDSFVFGGDGSPTSGNLHSLQFDLFGDGDFATGSGIDAILTSALPLPLAGLFEPSTVNDNDAAQSFWSSLLAGNDTIRAPEAVSATMTGDFLEVVSPFLADITLTGGNDSMFANSTVESSGIFLAQARGSPGLYGDALYLRGVVVNNTLNKATLFGGNDRMTLSGFARLDATGDADFADEFSLVVGGNDIITNNTTRTGAPSFRFGGATLVGDVNSARGDVNGGADRITGSDYAFYREQIVGDVENSSGTINGGSDIISGRAGQDTIAGDVLSYSSGRVHGGADTISGGEDSDVISGDVFYAGNNVPRVVDITGGNDRIFGDGANDYIAGDLLTGALADGSTLIGGADVISGGLGNDEIHGDFVLTNVSASTITGGNDRIDGGLGNDLIFGDGGIDTAAYDSVALKVTVNLLTGIATGQGTDTLVSIENVIGSILNDTITGNGGDNRLSGGSGSDILNGGDGQDILLGGDGNDRLDGGGDSDIVTGGLGSDRFVYGLVFGTERTERITDFENGIDRIDVSAFGFANFAAIDALATAFGAGLKIDLPGSQTLVITGLTLATFTAGDVIL